VWPTNRRPGEIDYALLAASAGLLDAPPNLELFMRSARGRHLLGDALPRTADRPPRRPAHDGGPMREYVVLQRGAPAPLGPDSRRPARRRKGLARARIRRMRRPRVASWLAESGRMNGNAQGVGL